MQVAEHYRSAWFDAPMLAAALQAGCDVLWSEDMHDGLVIGGRMRVVNPFAAS